MSPKNRMLYILLCLVLFAEIGYSQAGVKNLVLVYDTTTKEILKPTGKSKDLAKGVKYKFIVKGLNDALYSLKFSPQILSKTTAVPPVIQGIVGNATSTVVDPLSYLFSAKETTFNAQQYLLTCIDSDYSFISYLYVQTNKLIKQLNSDWCDSTKSVKDAKNQFDVMQNRFNSSYKPINASNLKNITDSVVTDFFIKIDLLKEYDKSNFPNDVSLKNVSQAYNLEAFVKKNKDFILKCPDIFKSVQKCKLQIASDPIKVDKGDYINLKVTIYKNNFSDKPDTVTQQIMFYKTKYWKIDYTVGVFFNNKPNPAYHFTDTTGHVAKETQASADLDVGALITAQYALSSCFKFGFSTGIGASVIDTKPRYFLGGSLVFGRKGSFMITAGEVIASLTYPTNALATNSLGNITTGFNSKDFGLTVPTYSQLSGTWFVGLTYNFFPH